MSRIAVAIQAAADAKGDLESALPGEWTMLVLLVAMTAVLGAAVLAGGLVRHRRVEVRRDEQREAYLRAYGDAHDNVFPEADHVAHCAADADEAVGPNRRSGADDRPRGRECG